MNASGPDDPFKNNPFRDGDAPDPPASNPFQSPPEIQRSAEAPAGVDTLLFQSAGYVRQVRPIAICMIVQGVLVTLMGGVLGGSAIFMANMPAEMMEGDAAAFAELQGTVGWIYGIVGVVVAIVGLLLVVAGIRNLKFRGRTLGIVALSVGVVSFFTCYCAPTGIGLAIWGLIVYLNPGVKRAFQMAEEGTSAKDLLTMVAR